MTADIEVTFHDDVHLRVNAKELSTIQELSEFFTFEVPGAKFTPAYKHRQWDGKIRLFSAASGFLYTGLLPCIFDFASDRNYTLSVSSAFAERYGRRASITKDEVSEFCKSLNLQSGGNAIAAYDYQVDAVQHAIAHSRALILSPTGSGKSLIIYSLCRYYTGKTLVVVPSTSLVEQLYSDFQDYSTANGWSTEDNVHRIYSGEEKITDKSIIITTWQSAITMDKKWFTQFDNVIIDESHKVKSKCLTQILTNMKNCRNRIGLTGTLDGMETNRLVIEGLTGKTHRVASTKDLMDQKLLSPLKIDSLLLRYNDETRKAVKKYTYPEEVDFLVSHPARNKFIVDLALHTKGNTLVLFQFVEKHGAVLNEMLQKRLEGTNRKLFYIHGEVEAEVRNEMRSIVENEKDAIILGSIGCMAVGINIRNLHNIVLATPSKSRIQVLQSIGRQLRKSASKLVAKLYDIGDDLSWKSHKNYTLLHYLERLKIYNEEQFEYRTVSITL